MPNYENGKIYKIHSFQIDKIYIGSTTQPLCKRFANHKFKFKKGGMEVTSKEILKYDDVMITLIESYPCNNKNELEKRERYHIENNNCVNKYIPTRTGKEWYHDNKDKISQYYIDNKDKRKQWEIANREKRNHQRRLSNITNKETISKSMKVYRQNNNEKLNQYDKYRNSHFGILCKSYGIFN